MEARNWSGLSERAFYALELLHCGTSLRTRTRFPFSKNCVVRYASKQAIWALFIHPQGGKEEEEHLKVGSDSGRASRTFSKTHLNGMAVERRLLIAKSIMQRLQYLLINLRCVSVRPCGTTKPFHDDLWSSDQDGSVTDHCTGVLINAVPPPFITH